MVQKLLPLVGHQPRLELVQSHAVAALLEHLNDHGVQRGPVVEELAVVVFWRFVGDLAVLHLRPVRQDCVDRASEGVGDLLRRVAVQDQLVADLPVDVAILRGRLRVRLPLAYPVKMLVLLLSLDAALVAIDAPAVLILDDRLAAPRAVCRLVDLVVCCGHVCGAGFLTRLRSFVNSCFCCRFQSS